MEAIEKPLADIFSKLPPWPQSLIDILRVIYPWILFIRSIFSLIGASIAFGFGAVATVLAPIHGPMFMFTSILHAISAIFGLIGGFRMLKGSKQGWTFALYSILVLVVISILDLSIFGLIIQFFMLWVLFQLRPYFTDQGSGTSSF